jgi:hypothetical protein
VPVANPSFEIAGDRPGLAQGWVLTSFTQLVRVGAFGSPPVGVESYAWGAGLDELASRPMEVALFDAAPEAREDYEEGWGGGLFEFTLAQAALGTFDGDPVEDFEWVEFFETLAEAGFEQGGFVEGGADTNEREIWTVDDPNGYVLNSALYWTVDNRPANALHWIQSYEVTIGQWDTLMTTI